jgi:hemolysin III
MTEKLKHYTPREERLSAYSHLAGVLLTLIAAIPLYRLAENYGCPFFSAGTAFYWLSLLAMFSASAVYHLYTNQWHKVIARKFDHCAIYLLITGTYAPLITGTVRNQAGYIVLTALIGLTIAGIAGKYLFANKFHYLEVVIYILMGWACVFIAGDLIDTMPHRGLLLLTTGGITYTSGVIFYAIHREFFHAIWHFFVLAGAILQFFAILTLGNI